MARPLDIPLLRTFVSLVEERSVTRVAHRLGRTQPAISLQIRRLEEAAGRPLFEPDLRHLRITRHGETLLGYARTILRTHDEARIRLAAEEIAGRVTLGCPDLYAAFLLPQTLATFRAAYPNVEVTVRCALSMVLAREISEGILDVALATEMPNVRPEVGGSVVLREEPLVWLGAVHGSVHRETPIPLGMLPEGNLYRDYALAALDGARRPWRVACVSESIAGLQAMALADAAVIVLARSVKVDGLRPLGPGDGLPPIRGVRLVLWQRTPGASAATDHLFAHIARDLVPSAKAQPILSAPG
jgi:DNA-binding transcriptional LysR family regulator